jgi:hypothetical protein
MNSFTVAALAAMGAMALYLAVIKAIVCAFGCQ